MNRLLAALVLLIALAAPAAATPLSDVSSAMMAIGQAKTFHIAFTSHGQSGDVDIVQPGKAHLTFGPIEVITIESATYVKMGGSWRQYTIPGVDRITGMYESVIRRASHPTAEMTVVDLGSKTVDGIVLHAYTFKHKDESVPTTLYLDGKGLPALVETDDGSMIRFSNINSPITINAPAM
jgi:hypothetical protein